jgi:uncharacterized cupredoxin-like copper-binding protein
VLVPKKSPVATGIAALAAGLGAALLAAGCGAAPEHAETGRTLSIAVSEYQLRPSRVTAAAGTLTIAVHNYGRLTHNLAILRAHPVAVTTTVAGTHTTTVSSSTVAGASSPIAPGQTATMTVALTPGRYTLASTILSDQSLGDSGTLTVSPRSG